MLAGNTLLPLFLVFHRNLEIKGRDFHLALFHPANQDTQQETYSLKFKP
jgi:hypothetical protein